MTDGFGRAITYLRVSVTDRCNLRCRYCMPEEGVADIPHADILTFDEIERVVRIMAGQGVRRVRITGGEPLVRRDVAVLAASIRQTPGVEYLGITTNATRLAQHAQALHSAGVDGVNISLDTTDPVRYAHITRRDEYESARQGLDAALALPFRAVKVNCVLAPGVQQADYLGVAALARTLPVDVRFIEWMPMTAQAGDAVISADEAMRKMVEAYGLPSPQPPGDGGPAQMLRFPGFAGRVGSISAFSHAFCAGCNRLRLSADGFLRLCLLSDKGLALKPLLRGGADDVEIAAAIAQAVLDKPRQHGPQAEYEKQSMSGAYGMARIGG